MTDRLTVLIIHRLGFMLGSWCWLTNKILLVACYCAVQLSMGIRVAGGCDTSIAAVCYGWLYPGQIQMQSSNPVFNL